MTPLDLFALTGIPAIDRPIQVSPMVRISEEGVEAALGWHLGVLVFLMVPLSSDSRWRVIVLRLEAFN